MGEKNQFLIIKESIVILVMVTEEKEKKLVIPVAEEGKWYTHHKVRFEWFNKHEYVLIVDENERFLKKYVVHVMVKNEKL